MPNLFFRTSIAPYRIDTYNALHEKLGCEMYFYHTYDSSQQLNEEGMRKACNFTPHYLKGFTFGKGATRKLCTEVWSILRRNSPDIVIVPEFQLLTIQVLLFKILFRKKFKVISMCDDSYDMVTNDNDFTIIHKYARRFIVPLVDDLLLVDSRVRDWYQSHYGKGIWLPIIRDEQKERKLYQQSMPISEKYIKQFELEGSKILLYVGRLSPEKNLDNLIRALDYTEEDFTTVLVGSGEQEDYLRQLATQCRKKIIFAGHYVDNAVRAWYNIADAFILPSKQEAYGAVTNEALIAGNHAIVSEHAGSACLIKEGNGTVIQPDNIQVMANAIDTAIKESKHQASRREKKCNMPFSFNDVIENVIRQLNQ